MSVSVLPRGVEPDKVFQGVVGTVFCGNRPVLTDTYGNAIRLSDYAKGPDGHSLILEQGELDHVGQFGAVMVRDLHDERDIAVKDRVTGFLIQASRLVVGDDAGDEFSSVLCGPRVAEHFDFESDAFAPVVGVDRDPLDVSDFVADELAGLVTLKFRKIVGCAAAWADEGSSYEAVLSPGAYKRRPDRAVVLGDVLWRGLSEWYPDLLGQELGDFLCLHVIRRRMDVKPAWMRTADEILKSADKAVEAVHVLPLTGVVDNHDVAPFEHGVDGREVTA